MVPKATEPGPEKIYIIPELRMGISAPADDEIVETIVRELKVSSG